jgi:hypothetical protein
VRERLRQSKKLLGIVESRFSHIEEIFKGTAQLRMNEKKLSVFLNRVFPDPQKPVGRDSADERYQQELIRAQQNRFWARYFFENGKGNKGKPTAGTLWAAYNGITEFVDHRARANQSDERRLYAIWFGDGYLVKARAFRIAEDTVRNPSGLWGRIWNRPQPVVQ